MTSRSWSWIGACATGSSHVKAGTGCQDAACCLEVPCKDGSALIAVVSDGAGSAEFSALGSRIVVQQLSRQLVRFASVVDDDTPLTEETAREWLDEIRDRIYLLADEKQTTSREFASTLVATLILPNQTYVLHVGDGACVVSKTGSEDWEVPSWPAHGEYASSTYFVTDDPQPSLRLVCVRGAVDYLAIFSDGLERLALDFLSNRASHRFFGPMFAPMKALSGGRARTLSNQLRTFLNSPLVTDRTDDDKSLILAKRVSSA